MAYELFYENKIFNVVVNYVYHVILLFQLDASKNTFIRT